MNKTAFLLLFIVFKFTLKAQVGIGTTNPNAILDIKPSSQISPVATDGIIIPKVNVFPTGVTINQDAMLVYLTTTVGSNEPGFYYYNYNTTTWLPIGGNKAEKIDDLLDGRTDALGYSVFLGLNSGVNDDGTSNANIGLGYNSLNAVNTGSTNVGIGYNSLLTNTTGSSNTAIGTYSMDSNIGGNYNVAIGRSALNANSAGNNNTAIGYNSGQASTGNSNVFIGYQSGSLETGSNTLYIQNLAGSSPLIGGDFSQNRVGINRSISALTNNFEVNGTASKSTSGEWLSNSDKRLKKDIEEIPSEFALEQLTKLKGVSYYWNDDKTGIVRPENLQYGFIAQDIAKVFPDLVTEDNSGFLQTAYGVYDPLYIQAIKELQKQLKEKDDELQSLKKRIQKLESLLLKN